MSDNDGGSDIRTRSKD